MMTSFLHIIIASFVLHLTVVLILSWGVSFSSHAPSQPLAHSLLHFVKACRKGLAGGEDFLCDWGGLGL